MINLKGQKNKGFTMVETLVAIFILLISVTGPLAIAQSGLRAAFIARDQTIAYYLAQDALEFIKNKRDNNFIARSDWLDGLENCVDDSCTIDTTTETILSCDTNPTGCSQESPLKIEDGTYQFGFTGEDSKFYRQISIDTVVPDQEVQVTVTVGWKTEDGSPRDVLAKENIFRWAPIY
ncbi:MAG TPA: prepilin-type N-terminal cleavage/methylation domain-containing protein [Candidatus Paceibacterota bacterium]|nr:prepilin-type N-terminal cleavage/methylation domain-containing protein [Candidatus Paceibacterota bacterium]HRZ34690.1 prepilin-type N-terminal cleavage/methylation domain-containing protein [Candidatus Paceibacterota bacterium]